MVDEWNLHQWSDEILKRWNEINLYQMTRGINRFAGLAMALSEIDKKYTNIPGIEALNHWVKNTRALSNGAIKEAAESLPMGDDRACLEKALSWSNAVNRSIIDLPAELKIPFSGAKEGLTAAHQIADVAVVSSANLGAVEEEWEEHHLLPHVDILLAQDVGTKSFCIEQMLKFGYDKEKTLMIGDAVGDMEAADKNGVYFFPILVNHEGESWNELISEALPRLANNSFAGEYQISLRKRFIKNLGG
jgi:phosphoglycolate phosphatase-like HAD superfamily hydrolase